MQTKQINDNTMSIENQSQKIEKINRKLLIFQDRSFSVSSHHNIFTNLNHQF